MTPRSVDPGRGRRRATSAVVGAIGVLLQIGAWATVGPRHPVFALVVTMTSFGLVPFLGRPLAPHLPRWLLDVPPGERVLHRLLGIGLVMRVLDAVRWNASLGRGRGTAGTRAGLRAVDRHTRESLAAHGVGALVHAGAAVAPAAAGAWGVAGLVLFGGLAAHVYPVLIQRAVRLRLAPLLARL